jgi:hypothetical protein
MRMATECTSPLIGGQSLVIFTFKASIPFNSVLILVLDAVDKNFMLHGELLRLHLSQGLDAQGLLLFREIQKFQTCQAQHQRL